MPKICLMGMHGDGMFSKVNLPALGTDFKLPVYLVMGTQDLLTSPVIARQYYDSISAPDTTRTRPCSTHN